MIDKNYLIKQLMLFARDSMQSPSYMQVHAACKTYSHSDCEKYVTECMPIEKIEAFENHCQECRICLSEVFQCFQKTAGEIDQLENKYLLKKTSELLGQLSNFNTENIMDVVILAVGRVLEVVRTTGEAMRFPGLEPARGLASDSQEKQAVKVRQDFGNPPLSIQTSVEKRKSGEGYHLCISIFDRAKEEFVKGVEISLPGLPMGANGVTDSEGIADFLLPDRGTYQASLTADSKKFGQITLTIE